MFSLNNLQISVFAQHGKSSERTIEESDRGLVIYIYIIYIYIYYVFCEEGLKQGTNAKIFIQDASSVSTVTC